MECNLGPNGIGGCLVLYKALTQIHLHLLNEILGDVYKETSTYKLCIQLEKILRAKTMILLAHYIISPIVEHQVQQSKQPWLHIGCGWSYVFRFI